MDTPRPIELTVGQTHTERLPGLSAAGYSWAWSAEGEPGILRVTLHRAIEGAPPGGLPPGTRSFDELLELHALAPGTVVLRLVQRRPWENLPPRDVRSFQVRVTAGIGQPPDESRR